MPSRMYFTRNSNPISPTPQGAWDDTAGLVRGLLSPTKSTIADNAIQRAETNASNTWDVLLGQWVSAALDTAQTVSGTFDLCISAFESNADADMVLHVHAWVAKGDGTLRGTLLSDYVDTHELPTTEAGVAITQQTLSGVAASVGDFLVVEVGYRAQNTITTSRNGRVRHGGNDATDQTAGDTTTSHPGWCEFGTAIVDAETRVDWQQKWYLGTGSPGATAVPPATRGGWDVVTSVSTTAANALSTATPGVASGTISLTVGNTTAGTRRLLSRYVSPPLNAGTIPASTYHITGLVKENATDQDVVWAVHLYLMKRNGDVRATLLSLVADATTANEWPTTEAGRQSDGFAIATQAISQDDRLVVEVGGKQLGTPAANGSIQVRHGGTGADAAAGDTDTTHPTWFGIVPDATPRPGQAIWVGP